MTVYGYPPTYGTSSGTTLLVYPSLTTNATMGVNWNWPGLTTAGTLSQNIGDLTAGFQQANMAWQSFNYSWPQYPETAAERADRERRWDEGKWYAPAQWLKDYAPHTWEACRKQGERHRAARAQVSERAEALLLGLLDEDQALSYIQRGWFEVTGSAGGRFRINKRGQAGNVDELPADGGDRIASYCIHPYGGYPDADAHVAQYLALVTDEPEFRRVANRTLRRYAIPQAA